MSEKEVILTKEGYEELEKQLEYLKTEKRYEISEQIKQARAFGDISENAEYDEAKNEQARVESEILEIESKLRHAKIVSETDVKKNVVGVGKKVVVHDFDEDEDLELTIVGSTEADPKQGKISNESPIGAALIGKKKGQEVEVETPAGMLKFKVLKIG
ncbi:MAG: transcription elongation factor GreA [Clostridia bacterium]|nr:transcription elongation factor GreA [Clostridia bacterium]